MTGEPARCKSRAAPCLGVKMVGVEAVLTGIAPADVHLARRQIDHQGADGLLAIQGIGPLDGVIADRIGQVDVILLDRLQRLDGVCRVLAEQAVGPEVAHPRGDQFLGIALDALHGVGQVVVCVNDVAVGAVQDLEACGGDLDGVHLAALVDDQVVVARGAMRDQRPADGAGNAPRSQDSPGNDQPGDADARVGRVDTYRSAARCRGR